MKTSRYSRLSGVPPSLGDELAIDRTALANQRTFLAYVRTGLALLVIGGTFLHFLERGWYHVAGYGFLAVGWVVLCVGFVQFMQQNRKLAAIRRSLHQKE